MIDTGDEGRIKEAVKLGLEIIEAEKNNVKGIIREGNIEYNLGNAKSSLFKFKRQEPNFKYNSENVEYIIDAKNHYWKAYKLEIDSNNYFTPELIVNLANTLSSCGRIVESLQYYDLVLKKYPDFPQANASRANELLWLKDLSHSFTQNLILQSIKGFEIASQNDSVSSWMKDIWRENAECLTKKLKDIGYNSNEVHEDEEKTKQESESHSDYRIYCIKNHLTLSEHSLYCDCIGARRDDLTICIPHQAFDAVYIPYMEKIVNRLKSEYSLARILFYLAKNNNSSDFNKYDHEVVFVELYDNEFIGTNSEMLRSSFRLCFGILDKIAHGICELYDLSDRDEPIYFERFWKPKNKNSSGKKSKRWEKINKINNISLVALYTQATDLNRNKGEWYFFKSWRNALEHGLFNLVDTKDINDKFSIYKNQLDFINIEKKYFINKTLQMLQFTRSAIFNFVFLVRNEAYNNIRTNVLEINHTLEFKNDIEK